MNKAKFLETLMAETGKSESECWLINAILEEHNIIGRKNKAKIVADFMAKLHLNAEEADALYNTCMGTIVKGIFRK